MVQVRNRCFMACDVTSRGPDFSINIEVNGEKQTAVQKTLIAEGYTYKYILNSRKHKKRC